MLKQRIGDLEIGYKDIADLQKKLNAALPVIRTKRQAKSKELRDLVRQEKALMKVLGVSGDARGSAGAGDE